MILSGDIDGALGLLQSEYPGLLPAHPALRLQLLSQRFVELVGQHSGGGIGREREQEGGMTRNNK